MTTAATGRHAPSPPRVTDDPFDLCRLSGRELDELFRRSPAGAVPDGEAEGVGLVLTGTPLGRPMARALRLAWRGKVFDAAGGTLVNRVLPFRLRAVRAKVYEGRSRLDGGPCIVLDYARTSLVARMVRDEIREVAPGLYLGQSYWGGVRLFRFALRFRPSAANGGSPAPGGATAADGRPPPGPARRRPRSRGSRSGR
ncbi:MAG TPA: hypothetical protein VFG47_11050 [Geminicoccaceae bacterium]|nr:hypothetical protein [Geminicoccaceae bacterium]